MIKQTSSAKYSTANQSLPHSGSGFTLLELMVALVIVSILASISLPVFRDEVEKAELSELVLRVDAMRTSMNSAYQQNNNYIFEFPIATAGNIPTQLANIISDNLTYPELELSLAPSNRVFERFPDGLTRPYLLVRADGFEQAQTLENFSEILPERIWDWWQEPLVVAVALLDTGSGSTDAPGSENPDPGSGGGNPDSGNPEPAPGSGGGNPDPSNPAPELDDPAPEFDDPAPEFDDPAPEFDDPAPGLDDPAPDTDGGNPGPGNGGGNRNPANRNNDQDKGWLCTMLDGLGVSPRFCN